MAEDLLIYCRYWSLVVLRESCINFIWCVLVPLLCLALFLEANFFKAPAASSRKFKDFFYKVNQ